MQLGPIIDCKDKKIKITSDLAEIILLSANFFDLRADDNIDATSLLKTISFIKTK